MLHSAGIHLGSSIRFAIPVDFQQDRPTIVSPSQPWPAGHSAGGHRAYPDNTLPEMVKQYGMEWHKVSHKAKSQSDKSHAVEPLCWELDGYLSQFNVSLFSFTSETENVKRDAFISSRPPFSRWSLFIILSTGHRNVRRGFAATKRHVGILGDLIIMDLVIGCQGMYG